MPLRTIGGDGQHKHSRFFHVKDNDISKPILKHPLCAFSMSNIMTFQNQPILKHPLYINLMTHDKQTLGHTEGLTFSMISLESVSTIHMRLVQPHVLH